MNKMNHLGHIKILQNGVKPLCTKASANLKHPAKVDIIGPPDSVSNLRPIIFAKSKDETRVEKKYREAREDTQLWNHKFWMKHNSNFVQERKDFQETLRTQGKTSITADDMSVFYKQFLDKNWWTHYKYNIDWYKRNVKLLFLELRVRFSKFRFK